MRENVLPVMLMKQKATESPTPKKAKMDRVPSLTDALVRQGQSTATRQEQNSTHEVTQFALATRPSSALKIPWGPTTFSCSG